MASMHRAIIIALVTLQTVLAGNRDQTQLERYIEGNKSYQIEVPGKEPITIIETDTKEPLPGQWIDVTLEPASKDAFQIQEDAENRYADVTVDHSRCLGPSCREENKDASPPDHLEEFLMEYADKIHGMGGDAKERLQAISSLASKLKQDKFKVDKYGSEHEDNEDKSYPSSWNRLKVKQHPYDDRDGWVTMEAVPWSSSKISKWKPNTNKHRPNHWDDDTYSYDDRPAPEETKRPTIKKRPSYINNQPHYDNDYNEAPSKPSWAQQSISTSYPSGWSPDEGRRPHKPNCDSDSNRYPSSDPSVYYGVSDSVVTDSRPSNFPYEYQALKRPLRRPTQVVYAGFPDEESRPAHPSSGDGQWVLLSTTKGYHHSKKRPRSMATSDDDDPLTLTSHRAVSLTVLPSEGKVNMTTSHGGMLEVERSFKTVEESKQDLDNRKVQESGTAAAPVRKKVVRRRLVAGSAGVPGADSSTVLAAVGAGMLPATMAMVVPMMLGRRRRRDLRTENFSQPLYRLE